ncbi:MAG TPA: hypothetical protein DCS12_04150 [Clostridiales bacterium]|nr:hypothetical protein [Clostridiales bacterium]
MKDICLVFNPNAKYMNKEEFFFPTQRYPEYMFCNDISHAQSNEAYDMVREGFHLLGYDKDNYGNTCWNPLGHIIKEGHKVLVKPNMVMDMNPVDDNMECMVTSPTIVKALIDYVLIALKGTGQIIIGDAPVQSCNFVNLTQKMGYDKLVDYYNSKGYDVKLVDFRDYKTQYNNSGVLEIVGVSNKGVCVNIGEKSAFATFTKNKLDKLRITNYPADCLKKYHDEKKHGYCVSPYVLEADVVINMPKPKTHRKAGITGALKNLVGITADKMCLPHHTLGAKEDSGDEYKQHNIAKKWLANLWDYRNNSDSLMFKRILNYFALGTHVLSRMLGTDKYTEGSWYGNDTIWRTILDLNRILLFCDKKGNLQPNKQRKVLNIADMIVAGEKEGPLLPNPKQVGCIVIGENPVEVDKVIASCMGYDWSKIPTISEAMKSDMLYSKDEINIITNINIESQVKLKLFALEKWGKFIASSGWEKWL